MNFKVEEVKTVGGARGLLVHVPGANTMSFEFEFRAGDRYAVNLEKSETPHIMEHLAFGANKKYKSLRKNSAALQKNGASFNAYTSDTSLAYYSTCADFEWRRILKHMLLQLESPKFLEPEFQAEFGNVKEELALRWNYDTVRLFQLHNKNVGIDELTFKDRLSLMDAVEHQDIIDHYKKTHTQANLRFIIAGKINASRKAAILNLMDDFELQKGSKREEWISGGRPNKKPLLFVPKDDASSLNIVAEMFLLKPLTKKEYLSAKLLSNMLTGTLHSIILGKAREKGWAYDISSGVSNWREYPGFELFIQVSENNATNVIKLIVSELKKISKAKLKRSELESVKKFALGSFQKALQTPANYLSYFSSDYYRNGEIRDYAGFKNELDQIQVEDIVGILNKFLESNIQATSVLAEGKHRKLAEEIKKEYLKLWA